jgi:GNAT superfamily N-acetyltransferase
MRGALNGIEAIERIARECFRSLAALPNARLIDDGRVFGVQTDVPVNFFSGIAMSKLSEDEVPRVLDAFRPRAFRWWISPSTRPANLVSVLVEHGLHHTYDATGMVMDLQGLPDVLEIDGFAIRRVTELDDWDRVFMEGFQRPESDRGLWKSAYDYLHDRWTHFVGYLDGTPIATTSVLDCGALAGIYHVVTLPPARGRGIGRAITVAALQHAKARGATHAALQASKMGFSVYRGIGFVPYCDLTLYDWRPSSPMS